MKKTADNALKSKTRIDEKYCKSTPKAGKKLGG